MTGPPAYSRSLLPTKVALSCMEGPVVRALRLHVVAPWVQSHSNFWSGLVSGRSRFNSTTLCK